jgi:hypothetical protein
MVFIAKKWPILLTQREKIKREVRKAVVSEERRGRGAS